MNVGVSELSREVGTSPSQVSKLMNEGLNASQIRERYRARQTLIDSGALKKPGRKPGPRLGAPQLNKPARGTAGLNKVVQGERRSIGKYVASGVVPVTDTEIVVGPTNGHTNGKSLVQSDNGWVGGDDLGEEIRDSALSIAGANLRKTTAQAIAVELHNAEAISSLVPVREVQNFMGGVILRARDMLTRQPGELKDRLAALDDPNEIERLLMAENRRVLEELAKVGVSDADVKIESGTATESDSVSTKGTVPK